MLAVDEPRASEALTEALGLYSLEQVCLQILEPVLVDIGELWLQGEASVAVEHFASAFVRTRLSNLFHASHNNAYGPLVLVACAPEELHELGAMFLAVFLRRAGFKVVYLGQNVPMDSLQGMVESLQPDVLCVSATRPETAANLYPLSDFLSALEKEGARPPILAYGGRVFNLYPKISERLGGFYLGENAGVAVRLLSERLNVHRWPA
jgi:methanogenic corrinoid protein MtbC1